MLGHATDHEGIKGVIDVCTAMNVQANGGKVVNGKDEIEVKNANVVEIRLTMATNFMSYNKIGNNPSAETFDAIVHAMPKTYNQLLDEHLKVYQEQFNRVAIDLGENVTESELPTDERLRRFQQSNDPALAALVFQYGRYLLISSSQSNSKTPANLQGIWNKDVTAPWDSKYTININAEMNYWPAHITNLSDTEWPLYRLINNLSKTGVEAAQKMYGAKGYMAHHNTDIWATTGMVDGATWGIWPNGAGWLTTHLWQRYLFTGDKNFLRTFYPQLKGAADFYLTAMVRHPKYGYMVTCPSISPEHERVPSNKEAVWYVCTKQLLQSSFSQSDLGISGHRFKSCLKRVLINSYQFSIFCQQYDPAIDHFVYHIDTAFLKRNRWIRLFKNNFFHSSHTSHYHFLLRLIVSSFRKSAAPFPNPLSSMAQKNCFRLETRSRYIAENALYRRFCNSQPLNSSREYFLPTYLTCQKAHSAGRVGSYPFPYCS